MMGLVEGIVYVLADCKRKLGSSWNTNKLRLLVIGMGETYTIQVSNNLVNRLATDWDKPKKKTKKPKPKTSKEASETQSKLTPAPSPPKSSTSPGWPLQPSVFLPVPLPPSPAVNEELEAIRSVLRESESFLEKLEKQEANMVQELTQRAKELHDKEFKLPYQNPMPCVAEKEACLECYKENATDPLKCADVVKKFADCARQARQQVSLAPPK